MSKQKKYFWLKLKDDFFADPKVKKLRRIAGGDTYTVIYLKMMLLSIKNGGLIEFQGIEKTLSDELSLILDEDEINVNATLIYLDKMGMIEAISDQSYLLQNIPELIGSETDSAERVRRLRQNKALQCNTDVTSCNTEIDKEKELETEKELEYNMCGTLTAHIIKNSDFDTFWSAYPKKVGKDKALSAWNKKKNKPHIELIIEAVQRYKLSKTVRDGFVCHPTTWINEGRWSDEIELSDYDKAQAIQAHTGMSASDTLAIQIEQAQREWEQNNA
jgi:predicted phage replisome organizer